MEGSVKVKALHNSFCLMSKGAHLILYEVPLSRGFYSKPLEVNPEFRGRSLRCR